MLEEEALNKDADKAKKKKASKKKKERSQSAAEESDAAAAVSEDTSRGDEEEEAAAAASSTHANVALELSVEQAKGGGGACVASVGLSASATVSSSSSSGDDDGKGEAGSGAAAPAAVADDVWITVIAKGSKQRTRQKGEGGSEQPRKQSERPLGAAAAAEKLAPSSSRGVSGDLSDSSSASQWSAPTQRASAPEHAAAQARASQVLGNCASSSSAWQPAGRAPVHGDSVRPRGAWGSGGTLSGVAAVAASRAAAAPQSGKTKEALSARDGTRSAPTAAGDVSQQQAVGKQGSSSEHTSLPASGSAAAGTLGSGETPAHGAAATTTPPPSTLSSPGLGSSQSAGGDAADLPVLAGAAAWPALDGGLKKESCSRGNATSASLSRPTAADVLLNSPAARAAAAVHAPAALPTSAAATSVIAAISEAEAAVSAVTALTSGEEEDVACARPSPAPRKAPTNWAALVKSSITSDKDSDAVKPTKPGFTVLGGSTAALVAPTSATPASTSGSTAAAVDSSHASDNTASTTNEAGAPRPACSCSSGERPHSTATQTSPSASPTSVDPKAPALRDARGDVAQEVAAAGASATAAEAAPPEVRRCDDRASKA